jgi:hypothetical protein
MHMNIIAMHGRNTRIGSSFATVSEFPLNMIPAAIPRPESKYRAKR